MENACLQCDDIASTVQIVYYTDRLKPAACKYYLLDDECEEAESSNRSSPQKSKKRAQSVLESESDDEGEISSQKLKKNRTVFKRAQSVLESESDDEGEISSQKLKKNRTVFKRAQSVLESESDDEGEISSQKLKKNRTVFVESDDEEEISSQKLKKNRTVFVESDDDEEISSQKLKKNQTVFVESDEEEEISSQKLKKNGSGDTSGGTGKSFLYSFAGFADDEEQLYERDTYAQPLIRSVWTGTFDVLHDESIYHRRRYCFSAYLSSKACKEARDAAFELEPMLHFEVLPASRVWPKSFHGSRPTDDDIAVYFFPALMKHESVYDSLVFEMIGDDLAMRAFVQGSELLIFTSIDLPRQFREFQGKRYLWGVFRGKRTPVDT